MRFVRREFKRGLLEEGNSYKGRYSNSGIGVTVFACVLPLTTRGYNLDMHLVWDVYGTRAGQIRTVCLGVIDTSRTDHEGKLCDKYTLEHSAFALLNTEHPEEFDVEIGIRKSFDRFLFSLLERSDFQVDNVRHNRKGIWRAFNMVLKDHMAFTKCDPHGVWSPNWKGVEEYPKYNSFVQHILD